MKSAALQDRIRLLESCNGTGKPTLKAVEVEATLVASTSTKATLQYAEYQRMKTMSLAKCSIHSSTILTELNGRDVQIGLLPRCRETDRRRRLSTWIKVEKYFIVAFEIERSVDHADQVVLAKPPIRK